MSTESDPTTGGPRLSVGPAGGQIAGFCVLAIVNAVMIALSRVPKGGMGTRALVHVFDAAQVVSLGVLSAGAVLVWQQLELHRRIPNRGWRTLMLAVCIYLPALALGFWMLSRDLSGPAGRLSGFVSVDVIRGALVAVCALGIPLAVGMGRLLARGYWRLVPLMGAVVVFAANHKVVSHDYPGVHFFVAWAGATGLGSALSTFRKAAPVRSWWRLSVVGGVALVSLWSLFVSPPNAVRLQLYRRSGCVVAPWQARAERRVRVKTELALPEGSQRWFRSRDGEPDVAPTRPGVAPRDAIVLLLVVDALRADVVASSHERNLPNITKIRDGGVHFTSAHSAAPGTTLSITSLLTSRYRSQIRWTDLRGRDYPHLDESPRFPELLSRRGVQTLNIQGLTGLGMKFGISRGFSEEVIVPGARGRFANSVQMMPALLQRLERAGEKPMFAYLHFEDAHAPYDSVTTRGTPFDRYLAEVRQVDERLGLLLDHLRDRGLEQRTIIVLTADHGEAFGEHGSSYHATTLYEELIHVPLVIRAPGVAPRKVGDRVSLLDIGPTMLDLFGVPTPGSFMGQSLVPALAGSRATLDRRVAAETDRDTRSMYFRDGMKVIVDARGSTVELYDLVRDPAEQEDLSSERGELTRHRAGLLEMFFEAHARK